MSTLQKLKDKIQSRYPVRLHMTMILTLVTLTGVVTSIVLLRAGITTMWLRYSLAVITAYLVFLLGIRLWIWYVLKRQQSKNASSFDGSDLTDGTFPVGYDSITTSDIKSSGGSFSGAGASGNFSSQGSVSMHTGNGATIHTVDKAVSGGSIFSGFFDDLDGDALVFIIISVIVVALLGAWAYLIYQTPVILSEAFFEFLLASGLIRRANYASSDGWLFSTLKSTVIPVLIILVIAGAAGFVASSFCPDAIRLQDLMSDVCKKNS